MRPPADVIVAGGTSTLTLALDSVRMFAYDRRGKAYLLLDKRGVPISWEMGNTDYPHLRLPSNRGMYTFYEAKGMLGTFDDALLGKLDSLELASIEPSIMLAGKAIDGRFMGAWEGSVSGRTGEGVYDFANAVRFRVELETQEKMDNLAVWGDREELLPDGELFQLFGTITNWHTSVKAADGSCLPAIATFDTNPFFGATGPEVDMFRLAAMHFPGDQVIVFTYPPGVSELSCDGMGGLGAFSTTDLFAVEAGANSRISIAPHATPNGHELVLAPVTGGGGACP